MKSTTNVQKSGWIVWWINTVIYFLVAVLAFGVLFHVNDPSFTNEARILSISFAVVMLIFMIAIQVLAYFMIRFIHRDNSYVYPIILAVLALFGPTLYLIPGIWGIVYANHQKLQR